jgi:DNA end-binding protein Ku
LPVFFFAFFAFFAFLAMLPSATPKLVQCKSTSTCINTEYTTIAKLILCASNKVNGGHTKRLSANREHIIALEPLDKGLVGTLLRYPYEVRSEDEYFDEIQDVKVTKDMLDLAKHIVNQKSGRFEPGKFEDSYETALIELINQKRAGKPITPKERPRGENVVDLMEALRRSVGGAATETSASKKSANKPRKEAAGQKEMLMPIAGKKQTKETGAKKPAAKSQRKSA